MSQSSRALGSPQESVLWAVGIRIDERPCPAQSATSTVAQVSKQTLPANAITPMVARPPKPPLAAKDLDKQVAQARRDQMDLRKIRGADREIQRADHAFHPVQRAHRFQILPGTFSPVCRAAA